MTSLKKLVLSLFFMIVTVFILIQLWIFTSLIWWKTHPVQTTMFMRITYFTGDQQQAIRHQWKDWHNISPYVAQAIIASEDGRFTQHNGFDWDSIERALINNQEEGEIVRGGSTISQQLAKNLFLFNDRSWLRKGQEAIATVMMEQIWSKKRILEVYMNSVEFGDHLYGVEAAAQHYFGQSAKFLTREQAAFLAAILPQPRYYEKHRYNAKLKHRQRIILQRMSSSRVPS